MKQMLNSMSRALGKIRFLPPLFFRLLLAVTFFGTFLNKIEHIPATIDFFTQIQIPFPIFSVYLAIIVEGVGALFLFLGFATRLTTIPLMILLIVAIAKVHWVNGFSCGQNGFEVPFYYLLMLFSLLVGGAGSLSIDALVKGQKVAK